MNTYRASRHRAQRGLTTLELIITMAITSIVLTVLVGIVHGAYLIDVTWGQRLYNGAAESLLPNALQADLHRLGACPGATDSYSLRLCVPGTAAMAVTYTTDPACGNACDVIRTPATGGGTVVARALTQRPQFATSCSAGAAGASGAVTVTGLAYPPGTGGAPVPAVERPLVVYYQAPRGVCG